MMPDVDVATAELWRNLGRRIGRKSSHGAAHSRQPEVAWLASGWDDFKLVCSALGVAAPAFYERSARMRMPDLGRVLDFGAGAGRLEPYLLEASDDVVAVDACSALLDECPRGVFRQALTDPGDVALLGTFDTVISLHVLYSMTPDGVAETVRALCGVLAPGGKAALDLPWTAGEAYHEDPDPEGLPGGWWVHSSRTLREAADVAGCRVVKAPPPPAARSWDALARLSLWTIVRREDV
jgi:SAM-dependent methyltransferase